MGCSAKPRWLTRGHVGAEAKTMLDNTSSILPRNLVSLVFTTNLEVEICISLFTEIMCLMKVSLAFRILAGWGRKVNQAMVHAGFVPPTHRFNASPPKSKSSSTAV